MSKTSTKHPTSGLLLRLSPELMSRFRSLVPNRQRARIVTALVEAEVERRERALEMVAREVEADTELQDEMREWDTTTADGIEEYVPSHDEAR